MTKATKVPFAPGVELSVVGDRGRVAIPGADEPDDLAVEGALDGLGQLLGDGVAVAELAVIA